MIFFAFDLNIFLKVCTNLYINRRNIEEWFIGITFAGDKTQSIEKGKKKYSNRNNEERSTGFVVGVHCDAPGRLLFL